MNEKKFLVLKLSLASLAFILIFNSSVLAVTKDLNPVYVQQPNGSYWCWPVALNL